MGRSGRPRLAGPVDHQRDWYRATEGPPCVVRGGVRTCGITPRRELTPGEPLGLLSAPGEGRKQVRWYARDIHHFAWSTSPDYVYEQGALNGVVVRVLYRPGDEASWGNGVAVRRTLVALQWLGAVFGDYPYPQVTNVHRIESGGTEFPMIVMNGSASQGLILHEVGHIYTHGILANNEWLEGWLDEGFTSFQTAWFNEKRGSGRAEWLGSEQRVLDLELKGKAEPVTLQAERYADMGVYSTMIYTKGSLVFWMLRGMVGRPVMAEILRTFYDRYRFRHVDQHAFQSVAEEVSGRDLDWFFGQWLHANGVCDYAVEDVRPRRDAGGWVTEVDVARKGTMRMPVPVRLSVGDQVRDTVVPGDALHGTHRIRTPFQPDRVDLDPFKTILDWNALNDAWGRRPFGASPYVLALDNPFGALPTYRDRAPLRVLPLGWFNDAGGVVGGLQLRSSYLGEIREALVRIGFPAVETSDFGGASDSFDPGSIYVSLRNPIVFDRPRFGTEAVLFAGEGRAHASLTFARDVSSRPLSGPRRSLRAKAAATAVYDPAYLTQGRWSPDTNQAGEVGIGFREERGAGRSLDVESSIGLDTQGRLWVRGSATVETSVALSRGWSARLRGFAGGVLAHSDRGWGGEYAPRERQFFLPGADPFAALSNPWIRSVDAPLDDEGVIPGGGGLVGYHPGISLPQLATITGEVRTPAHTVSALGKEIEAVGRAFGGVGLGAVPAEPGAPALLTPPLRTALEAWRHLYGSVGAGMEVGLAGSPIRVRFDVPAYVKDPAIANRPGSAALALRCALSVTGYR